MSAHSIDDKTSLLCNVSRCEISLDHTAEKSHSLAMEMQIIWRNLFVVTFAL